MSKIKSALLICFSLYIITTRISALRLSNQWQDSYPTNQRAVKIEDRIVIFSLYNNSLTVNSYSMDGKNESKTCEISPPSGDLLYFEPREGRVTYKEFVLGNGKIILFANAYLPDARMKKEKVYITFKPLDCSSVRTFKIDYEHIPCSPPKLQDEFCKFVLIPHHNEFDLFYPYWTKEQVDNTNIVSLRYDDQGNRLDTNVTMFLQNRDFDYPIYLAYLQTAKPFDSSEGYFGYFISVKQTDFIKFLHFNSQFKLVKEMDIESKSLDTYSPIIPSGLMTLCNNKISNQTCEIVDFHLDVKHRVVLKLNSESIKLIEEGVNSGLVVNWPQGGFVIVYIIDKNDRKDVYLKDVGLDGSTKVTKLPTVDHSHVIVDEIFTFSDGTICVILKYNVFNHEKNPYKSSIYCLQKSLQE